MYALIILNEKSAKKISTYKHNTMNSSNSSKYNKSNIISTSDTNYIY